MLLKGNVFVDVEDIIRVAIKDVENSSTMIFSSALI